VLFGLLAYLNTLDWRWLLGAIVLLANWPYTLFVIAPTNNRLMDTPPEAATAETRRMLERWGALHAGRSALGPRGNVDLFVGSAVRLLLTPAFRSRVAAFAQGTTVDRNSVAGLGASHDNRPGYRRGCPSQARVNRVGDRSSSTSSKAPRTSTVNSSPESTVIDGGVRVLPETRVFGPICPHVLLPCALQTPRQERAAQGVPLPQHNRSQ
jgi:hypothetical protein